MRRYQFDDVDNRHIVHLDVNDHLSTQHHPVFQYLDLDDGDQPNHHHHLGRNTEIGRHAAAVLS